MTVPDHAADRQSRRERGAATRSLLNHLVERVEQLPTADQKMIKELVQDLARDFPQMGQRHALELIYKIGTLLNERGVVHRPGETL